MTPNELNEIIIDLINAKFQSLGVEGTARLVVKCTTHMYSDQRIEEIKRSTNDWGEIEITYKKEKWLLTIGDEHFGMSLRSLGLQAFIPRGKLEYGRIRDIPELSDPEFDTKICRVIIETTDKAWSDIEDSQSFDVYPLYTDE